MMPILCRLALGTLMGAATIVAGIACATSHAQHKGSTPVTMSSSQGVTTPQPNTTDAFKSRCTDALAQARAQFVALEALSPCGAETPTLGAFNTLFILMDAAMNQASLFRNVHPDPMVRKSAEACEKAFSQLAVDIGLSSVLYDHIKALKAETLSVDGKRWATRLSREFKRAGVDKDHATRSKIRELKDTLVEIGQQFDSHIREDVRYVKLPIEALSGLPEDFIASHPKDDKGLVTLSTDTPDYIPFMSYAHDDRARHDLYVAFRQRGAPKNEDVLKKMLVTRHDLAQLLGYENYADYIVEDKMMGSARHVQAFIDKIANMALPRSKRDLNELLHVAKKTQPKIQAVQDWQKAYLQEKVKKEHYRFDAQAARQYFSFKKVRDGVLKTAETMFGVSFVAIEADVWHPSVKAYKIVDHDRPIGRFYLDLHPRENKYKHAAAFPMRTGVLDAQLPEAALVCNFPEGDDALMEHDEVQTFFHEFGHLLHHIFAGQQRYIGLSGIATEWDFVEAPSQMLEEWSYDPQTLKGFAKNKDHAPIPDDIIAAMQKARDFGKGLWTRQQMFYAATSLGFHVIDPKGAKLKNTDTLMDELMHHYSPFAKVPKTHFQLSFGHLEGYSALYYTYMWSLVIAKDLFTAFVPPANTDGLLSLDVAKRYRQTILAPGGLKDAKDLCRDFLGRDFNFDAFKLWLNQG